MRVSVIVTVVSSLCILPPGVALVGGDWPSWRGLDQSGVSRETGLPNTFSLGDDTNLLWQLDEGARSTPVVLGHRLYLVNRAGSGVHEQERVMCVDARSGKVLWEYRFNIYLTDIPSARVGWSSPTVDPETGHVYAHGVQNTFVCLDRDGKVVWRRDMHEEYGVIMGYGGRTHTPIIDEDRVIISFLNSSWGPQNRGRHRYAAFEKTTGRVLWWAEPGGAPRDTTYSTPVIATVNGVRLLIGGNADGNVYAMKSRTGEKVWEFQLSNRGINSSVVFWNDLVFACHSEENRDDPSTMGRLVCIDATGKGDVTKTHERWRIDGFLGGYSSPAVHDGRLYAIDNSANLLCVHIKNGAELWRVNIGRVMKGSPVVADGKVYVGETNGKFLVLELTEVSAEKKSEVSFERDDGTLIEIFGSPAVANGRVYFATTDALYCFGDKRWEGTTGEVQAKDVPPPVVGKDAAVLQGIPADVVLGPGDSVSLKGNLFDGAGNILGICEPRWELGGLKGDVDRRGVLTVSDDNAFQHGLITGTVRDLSTKVRVRVVPNLPFEQTFEDGVEGKPPVGWVGAGIKFVATTLDGGKVLTKVGKNPKFMDAETFFGLSTWKNYTVEADLRGTELRKKRQMPNIGLVNSRYSFILMGNHQELKIVSWVPEPRIQKVIDFSWDPDTWYRMKARVQLAGGKALAQVKVWPRDEKEPEAWTVELEDPTPNEGGSPALHGYSAGASDRSPGAQIFYDNVKVYPN